MESYMDVILKTPIVIDNVDIWPKNIIILIILLGLGWN